IGEQSCELSQTRAGRSIIDLERELKGFAEPTAALSHMALLITIDTAAAHLGGALGVRTWTMLPLYADWRWLRDREDSPWYPTMRLFRQTRRGEWGDVVERIREKLELMTNDQVPMTNK